MAGNVHTSLDLGATRTQVTVAEERLFHYISDEELAMLPGGYANPLSQICMLALGTVLSGCPGAAAAMHTINTGHAPAWDHLVALILTVGAAPVALVTGVLWRYERRKVVAMQAAIRARHKVRVNSTMLLTYPDPGDPAA